MTPRLSSGWSWSDQIMSHSYRHARQGSSCPPGIPLLRGCSCFSLSSFFFFFFYNLIDLLALWVFVAACGPLYAVLGLSGPVACGILASRPELKPLSSALEGRFFTSGSPGKSLSPALLRYNWHIPLYKFKVYNVTIRYTYILQNDYLKTVNTFITSHF